MPRNTIMPSSGDFRANARRATVRLGSPSLGGATERHVVPEATRIAERYLKKKKVKRPPSSPRSWTQGKYHSKVKPFRTPMPNARDLMRREVSGELAAERGNAAALRHAERGVLKVKPELSGSIKDVVRKLNKAEDYASHRLVQRTNPANIAGAARAERQAIRGKNFGDTPFRNVNSTAQSYLRKKDDIKYRARIAASKTPIGKGLKAAKAGASRIARSFAGRALGRAIPVVGAAMAAKDVYDVGKSMAGLAEGLSHARKHRRASEKFIAKKEAEMKKRSGSFN